MTALAENYPAAAELLRRHGGDRPCDRLPELLGFETAFGAFGFV